MPKFSMCRSPTQKTSGAPPISFPRSRRSRRLFSQKFHPAIKGAAKKDEAGGIAPHFFILVEEITFDREEMFPQPLFVAAAGLIDRGKRFHGEVISALLNALARRGFHDYPICPSHTNLEMPLFPKNPRRLLFALLATLCFQGCALDPDEKAFFYRSWLRPETDAEEQCRVDEQRHLHDTNARPPPHYKTDPLIDG